MYSGADLVFRPRACALVLLQGSVLRTAGLLLSFQHS